MDQHDENWLELGRQLKNYQPEGNPEVDFLDFQQLPRPDDQRRPVLWWLLLPLLLVVTGVGLYLQTSGFSDGQNEAAFVLRETERQNKPAVENASADLDMVQPAGGVAVTDPTAGLNVGTEAELRPGSSTTDVAEQTLRRAGTEKSAEVGGPTAAVAANSAEGTGGAKNLSLPSGLPDVNSPFVASGQDDYLQTPLLKTLPGASATPEKLVVDPIASLSVATKLPEVFPGPPARSNRFRFTLSAGFSDHWRGEGFLRDADYGLYANAGVYRSLGRRFGLEAQLGYRGHDMTLPVLSDAKEPWSYHKAEIHNTGHMGERRVYVYEGIVESYRAVELNLLVHYQLGRNISLHAGGRFSLPAIKFRRVVHGPDDENPFRDFIEGQEIVKYRDYGVMTGLSYRLTGCLSVQGQVQLGLVDLIENAAQEGDRFNRSNTLSVGVRYTFE